MASEPENERALIPRHPCLFRVALEDNTIGGFQLRQDRTLTVSGACNPWTCRALG